MHLGDTIAALRKTCLQTLTLHRLKPTINWGSLANKWKWSHERHNGQKLDKPNTNVLANTILMFPLLLHGELGTEVLNSVYPQATFSQISKLSPSTLKDNAS